MLKDLKNIGAAVSPLQGKGYERWAPIAAIVVTLLLALVADLAGKYLAGGYLDEGATGLFYLSLAVTGGIIRGQFPDKPSRATRQV